MNKFWQFVISKRKIKNLKITCLIPFFNEKGRVESVLEKVLKIPEIDEVIAIDDCSIDGSYESVKKKFREKVTVLRNEENLGKTDAIRKGLVVSSGDYIFLCDADLQNFIPAEFSNGFKILKKDPKIDMIIFNREKTGLVEKLTRSHIYLCGERVLKKADLEKILEQDVKGYQVEMAINMFMIENKKNVLMVGVSTKNTIKEKKGIKRSVKENSKMLYQILAFSGIAGLLSIYLRKWIKEN